MLPSAPPPTPFDLVRSRMALALASAQPATPTALWHLVRALFGLTVPRVAVCPDHAAPFDYLVASLLGPPRDLVVWASRGGAKTELGSIGAALDSLMRPGCQTRILGGSLDQSEKMYEYLLRKWTGPLEGLLSRDPTLRRTELTNGSTVEVLTQSPRSVRGQRVHRLKCDEVDEFSPEVWQAAQFVTQSSPGRDGRWIPARMEIFSTLHRAAGPMSQLIDRLGSPSRESVARVAWSLAAVGDDHAQDLAHRGTQEAPPNGSSTWSSHTAATDHATLPSNPTSEIHNPHSPLLLKWCLWEVLEPCPPDRSCSRCPLWSDCGGRARRAAGYFPIDDALAQHARASREAWESEMLCLRPRSDRRVFGDFDPARHVAPVAHDPSLPLYRALDFGYANPFVCLWVQVATSHGPSRERELAGIDPPGRGLPPLDNRDLTVAARNADPDLSQVQIRVLAEYVERERPVSAHARELAARDPGPVVTTYADPAGWQRSDVTGTGPCQELARLGIKVRTPRSGILEGVELLRRLLKPRPGGPGLVIDPKCRWLIRAFQEYHWDDAGGDGGGLRSERPAKDGPDHCIDALRYLMAGLYLRRGEVRERLW